jgi:hypothetical protein
MYFSRVMEVLYYIRNNNTRGIGIRTVRKASLYLRAVPKACQHLYQQGITATLPRAVTAQEMRILGTLMKLGEGAGGHCLLKSVLFDGFQQTHAPEMNFRITRDFVDVQRPYLATF